MTHNLMEGETPLDDWSGLLPQNVRTRGELNLIEAENIRRATVKYLGGRVTARMAPFEAWWFCRLHGEMFCDAWEWAGRPRRSEKNLGVVWHTIPEELRKLADDAVFWAESGAMTSVEKSARLHHRAVFIHPFENGNGRWARLLANIFLRLIRSPIVTWPESAIGSVSVARQSYLDALRAADHGDYETLTNLHREWTQERAT